MKKSLSPLWVALTVWLLLPGRVGAQMDFSLDETESSSDASAQQEAAPAEGDQSGGMGDVIGSLAAESQNQETETEDTGPRRDEQVEEIYAVQQVYALRRRRAELMPNAAFNVNDPYQSHVGVGLSANYWWTNVLAIGANFLWYDLGQNSAQESNLGYEVRRSTRLAIPMNQWQTGAWLNFTYVPLYGKFAMFNKFIFQWDAYLVGGVGLMRTRPIPVIDQAVRNFDWQNRMSFDVGLGIRVFLSRWLAFVFEIRDYMWIDKYENLNVAPLITDRVDPNTWYQSGSSLVNNVSMGVGLTFFIPPRFEYRLPK
ncbi:MAG: outer membrane beta-barrel domain-containing protein [Polyangiales bacterium]